MEVKRISPLYVVRTHAGTLLFFYRGKVPTRLQLIVLTVSVQLFTDEVANYTSCDEYKKSGD